MNANEKPHIPFGFDLRDFPTDDNWTLKRISTELCHPDPRVISTREQGGVKLSYVGHAEITRQLCYVDPFWTWEPLEIVNGAPAIHIHVGKTIRRDHQGNRQVIETSMASMWGRMTVLGCSRVCVGTVEADKPDRDKELASDLIKNGAMRFGIALGLWLTEDPPQVVQHPASAARSPQETRTGSAGSDGPRMASDGQKRFLRTLAGERGYSLPDLGAMTAKDAYDLTEKLKGLPRVDTPATDQEEPF